MNTVIGVFSEPDDAEQLIDRLEEKGYNPKEISIVVRQGTKFHKDSGSKGGAVASGTVSGAATGGVIGGLAGLLIGIGAIAIPGIGAFLIGGPLAVALGLTGAAATTVSGAATGMLAGGLVGALVSLGLPEEEAREYQERVQAGGVLLAVPVRDDSDARQIKTMFSRYNADQIRILGEMRRRAN